MMNFLIGKVRQKPHYVLLVSLLTAFFYAFQHPLANPFYKKVAYDLHGLLEALLITELALFIAYAALFLLREVRDGAARVIADGDGVKQISLSVIFGILSIVSYIVAQANLEPSQLSLVLNSSPFVSVFVAFAVSRKYFSRRYFCFAALLTCVVIFATYLGEGSKSGGRFGWYIYLLVLFVPAFFYAAIQIIADRFRNDGTKLIGAVALASLLSSSLAFAGTALFLLVQAQPLRTPQVETKAILLLIVGTLIPAVAGRILYHIALEVEQQNQEKISISFYMVPSFTIAISLAVAWLFSLEAVVPHAYQVAAAMMSLTLVLIYNVMAEKRKRSA